MGLKTTTKRLKEKAKQLKNELTAMYYALQDQKTPKIAKLLLLFTLGYALSPIDLVPDFIPILGYLDDLIILPLLLTLAIKMIPTDVLEQSRLKAKETPLKLKKNWFFACFFIGVWVFVVYNVVKVFVN